MKEFYFPEECTFIRQLFVCETIGGFRRTSETDVVFPKTGYAAILLESVVKSWEIGIVRTQASKQDVTRW